MAIGLQHLTLAVFLACLHLVATQPRDGEASLEGPRGMKVFVGRRGGAIRLYRELEPGLLPNDGRPPSRPQDGDRKPKKGDGDRKRPPPRSGEIAVRLGRIQEVDGSSKAIDGQHGVNKPESVDFTVTTQKYVIPSSSSYFRSFCSCHTQLIT